MGACWSPTWLQDWAGGAGIKGPRAQDCPQGRGCHGNVRARRALRAGLHLCAPTAACLISASSPTSRTCPPILVQPWSPELDCTLWSRKACGDWGQQPPHVSQSSSPQPPPQASSPSLYTLQAVIIPLQKQRLQTFEEQKPSTRVGTMRCC